MPNNYNFSKLSDVKEIKISPNGWVDPIVVEYDIIYENHNICHWRVKGTQHTFSIPVIRLDFISSGDYGKHFTEVLEKFKDEYNDWKEQEFKIPWMHEYNEQYRRFIL